MTQLVIRAEDYPPLAPAWGNPIERETRRRIQVSVAAYAYEIADRPIMSDSMFDWLAGQVQRRMGTAHPLLDEFFATEFTAMTGMWIHRHPELGGIERIFTRYWSAVRDVVQDRIRRN